MSPGISTTPSGAVTFPYDRRRRRRHRLLVYTPFLVAVIVVAAVLYWGWATRSSGTGPSSTGGSTGPDPNPQHDRVLSITGKIIYTGNASGYLSIVEQGNLCSTCPTVVPEVDRYSPPVAGLLFFLNVSNTDTAYHTFGNFSINATAPTTSSPFHVYQVECCYPVYGEEVDNIGVTAGHTFGLLVFIAATSLEGPAEVDYVLQLSFTSSD